MYVDDDLPGNRRRNFLCNPFHYCRHHQRSQPPTHTRGYKLRQLLHEKQYQRETTSVIVSVHGRPKWAHGGVQSRAS